MNEEPKRGPGQMTPQEAIKRPGAVFTECKWLLSDPDPVTGCRESVVVDSDGQVVLMGMSGRLMTDPPEPPDTRPWWKKIWSS